MQGFSIQLYYEFAGKRVSLLPKLGNLGVKLLW